MAGRRAHPLWFLRWLRSLHVVFMPVFGMALASMAPAPGAAIGITVVAILHPVPIAIALRRSAAQRQTTNTEDHQQTKYYDFRYEHVSPFRHSSNCS